MKTVLDEWRSYERDIIPTAAPTIQREECRRAFYAGAAAVYWLTLDACEPKDEDVCADNLALLSEEIRSMATDLRVEKG